MSELKMTILEEENTVELLPVEGDMEADRLIREIREAQETKAFWKAYYQEKQKEVNDSCDLIIEQNTERLRNYFDTVPHKKTPTQEKYPLPSGKLVMKDQEPDYDRDDKTVIKFLKANGGEKFVKVKEELDWSGLKKTLSILGETAADENGNPIPGIKVIERDRAFTIEK
jgi:phage host-nuclease inhibitor protein Gam